MRSNLLSRALVAAAAAGLVVATATPASAYTSFIELKQSGNMAAIVWYNSGTHNMTKGRNSFTLRAAAGTTWAKLLYTTQYAGGKWNSTHKVTTSGGNAAEITFSDYKSDTERHWIKYRLCMYRGGTETCSVNTITDYID
ncbi:hypothetical protein AB0G15_25340 [Streptosporangium sp. NPDC023825]|uniref:hypothetical protein n=1 Tax=Streptosporangium sp. NPDC023825 TaxID=3154909 RepID=UPI003423360F